MTSMEVDPEFDDQDEGIKSDTDSPIAEAPVIEPRSPRPGPSGNQPPVANGGFGQLDPSLVAADGVLTSASAAAGSVSISLHPLVIMNVSEHWTRLRAQESTTHRVIGALIGKQKGRTMEICNSFELLVDVIDGVTVIDSAYYATKEEQFKQVFPDLDFLGWYTSGEEPTEGDIKVHKQICEQINEQSVFLKLNAASRQSKLPISMYESVIDLVNGEAKLLFVPLQYTLITEEAERIGLDHMARLSSTQNNGEPANSVVAEHLRCQLNAVKMLRDRVQLIRDFVRDTQEKKIDWNHEILRESFNLSHRLPVVSNELFKDEFFTQCNDVGLQTYLGMLTKGTNSMNQFVNKFNLLYDRQGMGRRMRGLFF